MIKFNQFMLIVMAFMLHACNSTREYWRYVVEDDADKPKQQREKGTPDSPRMLSPHNVKVVFSDGSTSTEVLIPVLSSGQQILVDHNTMKAPNALTLAPLPPTAADKDAEESYSKQGLPIQKKAPVTSIVKTHEKIRELVKDGQYELALQYAEQLLSRYPNHVKTLRTKGSLLLKIGETDAALKTYQKAQEVEFDPRVEDEIKKLEKNSK